MWGGALIIVTFFQEMTEVAFTYGDWLLGDAWRSICAVGQPDPCTAPKFILSGGYLRAPLWIEQDRLSRVVADVVRPSLASPRPETGGEAQEIDEAGEAPVIRERGEASRCRRPASGRPTLPRARDPPPAMRLSIMPFWAT